MGFCKDSEGWGPLTKNDDDLTLCSQAWIVIFPFCLIIIIAGLIQAYRVFQKQRNASPQEVQKRLSLILKIASKENNQDTNAIQRLSSSIVNMELIACIVITLGLSYGIAGIIFLESKDTTVPNWVILTLISEFLAWVRLCLFMSSVCLTTLEIPLILVKHGLELLIFLVLFFWL